MHLLVYLLLVAGAAPVLAQIGAPTCPIDIRRKIGFGVATAAYQVEGCTTCDGRSESIWDVFARQPGRIADGSDGSVTTNMYRKYAEDFASMKRLGIKHHRFSIAWGRIIPSGRKGGKINQKGVEFYNALVDSMLANGVSPAATLFHWDLPQALQDAYGGFTSPNIIEDYVYFAETCFRLFGDRIKKWVTFNEPWIICNEQWGNGNFAPGVQYGDRGKWACGHYLLLAHARTVEVYRKQYKPKQRGGKIGMALWSEWSEPFSNTTEDRRAAQNKMDIDFGWFADTIHFGDYPRRILEGDMNQYLPARFTDAEKALLRRSYDYIGLTFYTGKYARAPPGNPYGWIVSLVGPDGKVVGPQAQSYWLYYVPWAAERMLTYVTKRYGAPEIWVLENGASEKGEAQRSGAARFRDPFRTKYFKGYIDSACKAVKAGARLTHYFMWSYLDNWEWREGFNTKFGIVHVDFASPNRTRTPKDSAKWLSRHIFAYSAP